MSRLFLYFRWSVFVLFVVCNSVICSVAAWNLSLVQHSIAQIDIYLLFLSALGLLYIFPILLVDIARKNAATSQVWFELSWVAIFFAMNTGGAAAVSTVMQRPLCQPSVMTFNSAPCSSTRTLMAFSWLSAISLFSYLILLAVSALLHQRYNKKVWHCGVRDFRWFESQQSLRSAPSTPVMANYGHGTTSFHGSQVLSVKAPKPRRAAPAPILVSDQRTVLTSHYEIEHYQAPEPSHIPAPMRTLQTPAALYAPHMQASLQHLPKQALPNPGPSPPPLRDWPQPITAAGPSDRPPRLRDLSSGATREQGSATVPLAPVVSLPSPPNRSRPTGPRTRSSSTAGSRTRPPPLDLSGSGSSWNPRR